jgi:hypothetical protein
MVLIDMIYSKINKLSADQAHLKEDRSLDAPTHGLRYIMSTHEPSRIT